jgi:adenine C2-methylase RlmN of 23S rRNA A2503 and tRNA A37
MRLYLLLLLLLAGCSTPIHFCESGAKKDCRPFTASDITGTVVRGHGEEKE